MPAPDDPPDAPERATAVLLDEAPEEAEDGSAPDPWDALESKAAAAVAGAVAAPAAPPPLDPDLPPFRRWWQGLLNRSGIELAAVAVDVVAVAAVVIFVVSALHPEELIRDTTPAGGDMGAHVWGPAFLRDHLLPSFRLSGWTPDWYAGFPAYTFYMVVPALAIVALDAGFSGWAALVPMVLAVGLLVLSGTMRDRRFRRITFVAALVGGILLAGLPYGIAFKFVAVAGLVSLPICCYVFGRLADLPFPTPALLSVASLLFLFNKEPEGTGNIIGGNVASTLAGEFSFSLSLALLVLYLGFLLRGMRTGRYRATAAVLLGLCALCHIIPTFYAVVATAAVVLVSLPLDRARLRWFLPVAPVAVAISAFWLLPFVANRAYLNDMGWEKLPTPCSSDCKTILDYIAPSSLQWLYVLALVGAVVSVLLRIRAGVALFFCAVATAVAFVIAPQGRLWNARLLPFLYLCVALLAAIAVAELARAIAAFTANRPERHANVVTVTVPLVLCFLVVSWTGLLVGNLWGVERTNEGNKLGPFSVSSDSRLVVGSWAEWNFSGYEDKPAYPEYYDLLEMGRSIGADPELGCGRVMWEYEGDRLERYGTPMAPMLLPFWTDGCMGSMEGLYFEASATTPYHFLNQRALSANCSCAQRDLPYRSFDIDVGVAQLQEMGVRYYFASTDTAIEAAARNPDLTEVATTDVWHAYLVADSELVSPLAFEPVVLTGMEPGMDWVGPASKAFRDPAASQVPYAEDGPASWTRVPVCDSAETAKLPTAGEYDDPKWTRLDVCEPPPEVPLAPNTVSGIEVGTDTISFDVANPGVPVVVKVSYFPNWRVSGAEGPYRLSPNLMVVIPTQGHVELSYGRSGVEVGSSLVSIAGIAGAVLLSRRRVAMTSDVWLREPEPDDEPEDDDEPEPVDDEVEDELEPDDEPVDADG